MSFRARIERFYFTGEWADLRLGSVPLCLSSLQDLPQLILHARHVVFLKDSNYFLQHDCFQPLSGYQTKKCPDERALFTPRDMTCFSERQRLNHRQFANRKQPNCGLNYSSFYHKRWYQNADPHNNTQTTQYADPKSNLTFSELKPYLIPTQSINFAKLPTQSMNLRFNATVNYSKRQL